MSFLIAKLLSVPTWLALVLVFLFPALEASTFLGFVFPGETAVIVGGVLASQAKFPVWAAGALAASGAIIGDSVGYWVGSRYGRRLLRVLPTKIVRPEAVDSAIAFIARRGAWGVVIGRFTTALRVLIPGAAGISEMRYSKFLLFNALGGIAWAALYTGLGYVAGANFATVVHDAGVTSYVVLGVVIVGFVGYGLYRHLHSSTRHVEP
ncbi:MAG: DedA family protein [Ferrimicrobium sp.]